MPGLWWLLEQDGAGSQDSAGLSGSGEYSDSSLAFSFSPDVFLAEHAWVDAFIRGSYNQ